MVAMTRDRGGGEYTPDICQACGEDRRGKKWVGRKDDPDRMCRRCFTEGRAYPTVGQCQGTEGGAVLPPETTSEAPIETDGV